MKEEFKRLQPNAQDMCVPFSRMLPKLLSLPERRREIILTHNDGVYHLLIDWITCTCNSSNNNTLIYLLHLSLQMF